jgi:hypothetical protein
MLLAYQTLNKLIKQITSNKTVTIIPFPEQKMQHKTLCILDSRKWMKHLIKEAPNDKNVTENNHAFSTA